MSLDKLRQLKQQADIKQQQDQAQQQLLQEINKQTTVQIEITGQISAEDQVLLRQYSEITDHNQLFKLMQNSLRENLLNTNQTYEVKEQSENSDEENYNFEEGEFIITELDRRSVRVSNLSQNALAEDVKIFCQQAGTVKSVEMKKKFAFVEFETEADAVKAIMQLSKGLIKGKEVKVDGRRTVIKQRKKFQ
ncbi:RNA_recognition motif domain [Hexamita inflata]|uniref:RNA recognition motif domain n=1 Tax=Hexamita inflata TaxID=28002 RepID=A0AA86PFT8_9EUKA|nr:RNA recognition motif domain [Hexamita inflata]